MTKNDLVSMLARWAITLQQYSLNIVHRPGEHHQNADCLSRMPQESTEDSTGARLHDEQEGTVRCDLTVQLAAFLSAVQNRSLHRVFELPLQSHVGAVYAPSADELISRPFDCQ